MTASPSADTVGSGITVVPIDNASAADYPQLIKMRICAQATGSNAVIIGHSNSIPAIAVDPVSFPTDLQRERVRLWTTIKTGK